MERGGLSLSDALKEWGPSGMSLGDASPSESDSGAACP
jgi:hypothetical protein